MRESLLIKNASVIVLPEGRLMRDASIVSRDGVIERIGKGTLTSSADAKIDASGRLVMPALSCTHTHLYSFLARGMNLKTFVPPNNFVQILENLWWRLDAELTLKDVSVSAQGALAELARCGVVSFIDHHASPNAIKGSLDAIAKEVEGFGLRARLSYEVTDRHGKDGARCGIIENASFIKKHKTHPSVKGDFGLHASLTISDETLERCIESVKGTECGFHVHVAEDAADQDDCVKKHGLRVVERFHKAGILGSRTIAAHCVHISGKEIGILSKTGTNVVHNPQSNMNNAVGVARIPTMLSTGVRVGLGTDGFTSDMFQESKAAFTVHKLALRDPKAMPPQDVYDMLFRANPEILGFGNGLITEGAPADMMVLDYKPPTPLTSKNIASHFIFGMSSANVEHVVCNGKLIVRDRNLVTADSEKIINACTKHAESLWKRIDANSGR